MNDPSAHCETCRFFQSLQFDRLNGTCARHAPIYRQEEAGIFARFPMISRRECCEEYQRIPPQDERPEDLDNRR